MPYAIEFYLDNNSSKKISKVIKELELNNVNIEGGTHPHITVAIYNTLPISSMINELLEFISSISLLNITFSSFGVFPGEKTHVIFLAPVVTREMIETHEKFYEKFKHYEDMSWDMYKPGKWVPHCTLGFDVNDKMLHQSMDIIKKIQFPFECIIDKFGIIKFNPNEKVFESTLETQRDSSRGL